MKLKKLIGGLLLSTVLAAGVGAFIKLQSRGIEKVEAATATTVYYAVDTNYTVKCNVNRKGDGDDWQTYVMTKVDGTEGIYKATFTDLYNGLGCLQFQLYDGDDWKGQEQPISNWTSVSTYNNKLYYNGAWTTSFKEVKKAPTLTSTTGRVFFNNSGTHWASGGACAVYAWGGDATKTIDSKISMEGTFYHFTWFQDGSNWYGYADIPTNITGYKIAKLNNDNYVTSLAYDSTNTFTADSFAYVRYGQTSGNWIDTNGAKDVANAPLMTKVIEAYNTCSDSYLNGYGAYNALNSSFYSLATSDAKSTIAKSFNGKNATIQSHFEGMAQRSVSVKSYSSLLVTSLTKGGSMIAIISISAVSLAAVGGYFLFRKKKEN